MSEEQAIYTDTCGVCGALWIKRGVDFKALSDTEIRCRCGAGWSMTKQMAAAL